MRSKIHDFICSKFLGIGLVLFIGFGSIRAQIVTYNRANTASLSGEVVSAIYEDLYGFLWFGTDKGISRFDLVNNLWEHHKKEFENGTISKIIGAKDGSIWVASRGDYCAQYELSSDKWTTFAYPKGPAGAIVNGMEQTLEGDIWFATYGYGVSKYDGDDWAHYTKVNGLASNLVNVVFIDSKNNKWFGTTLGVSKFDDISWTTYSTANGLPSNKVTAIGEQQNGNLWFGTLGGVCVFNGNNWTTFTTKEGLPDLLINSLMVDNQDRVWIATLHGVAVYDNNVWTSVTMDNGLIEDASLVIYQTRDSSFYIGHSSAGVSVLSNTERNKIEHFEGIIPYSINAITEDKKGNIWLGSAYYVADGVSMFDGEVWKNFSIEAGLPSKYVTDLLCDASGKLWAATDSGLATFEDNKWTTVITSFESSGIVFYKILEDSKLNLWFCTQNGVLQYDGNTFTYHDLNGRLSGNYPFFRILENTDGAIWCASYAGILQYKNDYWEALSPNINVYNLFKDSENKIWVTNFDGLNIYQDGMFESFMGRMRLYSMNEIEDRGLFVGGHGFLHRYYNGEWKKYNDFFLDNSDKVQHVYVDSNNSLWVTHGDNISRIDSSFFIKKISIPITELQDVSIFPNPVLDILTFQVLSADLGKRMLEIYDVTGKLVFRELSLDFNSKRFVAKIDMKHYASGIYFCKIQTDNKMYISKIIKSRD